MPSHLRIRRGGAPGAVEEGGVKTTIGMGGEGEWAKKLGCNNDDKLK
jgi:hypothetical protein